MLFTVNSLDLSTCMGLGVMLPYSFGRAENVNVIW